MFSCLSWFHSLSGVNSYQERPEVLRHQLPHFRSRIGTRQLRNRLKRQRKNRRSSRLQKLGFEILETRQLLAGLTVNSLADLPVRRSRSHRASWHTDVGHHDRRRHQRRHHDLGKQRQPDFCDFSITGNQSSNLDGGGIYSYATRITLTNSLIAIIVPQAEVGGFTFMVTSAAGPR